MFGGSDGDTIYVGLLLEHGVGGLGTHCAAMVSPYGEGEVGGRQT